jgi:hypothetical protein
MMIFKNSAPPPGVVFCNFRTAKTALPAHDQIPTLIKDEALSALLKNEENPRYVVEAVDYPVKGTGGVYTEKFFESYLDRMKAHPFGGNKLGHSYPEKNDFYTIGGKIEKNGSGESGTVYFKILVPSMGYETTNSGFIRDVDAKNVHFSLVTRPEFELKLNEKTREMERHFTKSIGEERNDAVPFEGGSMPQQVNSRDCDTEQVRSLIENGQVDYKSKPEGDEIIQNGLVTYSALRRLAAGADSRTPELIELVSLADKKRNRRKTMGDEDKVVTKEEAIRVLAGLFTNGLVSVQDITTGIGPKAAVFLRNEQDEANAALANSVRERLGDSPLDELEKLINTKAQNEMFLVQNSVRSQVGTEKIKNAKGEEVDNPAYQYAIRMCNGKSGRDLQGTLEALKTDVVMQSLLAAQADHGSEFNCLEEGGGTLKNAAGAAGQGSDAALEV